MSTSQDQQQQLSISISWTGRAKAAFSKVGLFILSKVLDIIIVLLLRHGKPGRLTEAQKHTAVMIKASIYARLVVEGYISKGRGANRYPEWDELNARLYEEGSTTPAACGTGDRVFMDGLEKLVGERFSSGNRVQALINGPASFEQRYSLIEAAEESIYIATWKLYGDETGANMVDTLLAKRERLPDLDVRIMADGNVATQDSKSLTQLRRLIDANIPVAFHHYDEKPFNGFHYKLTVVDGATDHPIAVAGGMNIGNVYSHGYGTPLADNPDRKQWRDTDIRIDGPSARDDYLSFIRLWNDQASRSNAIDPFGQTLAPITLRSNLPLVSSFGEALVLTTIDEPDPHSRQKVTLTMVYAIHAAKQSIDIENAYFMDVPAIIRALVEAMKRGVTVRILTNSTESVDEKVVAVPILKGLYTLMKNADAAGMPADRCLVYTRKKLRPKLVNADTLHSKFMVVDQEFTQVASFNIHARSLRLEVEGAHNIVDREIGKTLSAQFDRDIEDAKLYRNADEIDFPDDLVSRFLRYMHLDPVLM
ncbi:MAG: phosphatidylserine/phosphatidylglycerophosphate/cardiolipin synthase family protein [Pseudomonadota bacterium]